MNEGTNSQGGEELNPDPNNPENSAEKEGMKDTTAQSAPGATEPQNEAVIRFISQLPKMLGVLDQKSNLRLTHQGLFVSESFVDRVVECYQQWLEKETRGEVQKSFEKAKKRLFGSLQPESYYLIEGKITLSGPLLAFECREPQRYGLPYYLAPLSAKRSFLHPKDPALASVSDLVVVNTAEGSGINFKIDGKTYEAGPRAIQYFLHTAQNSKRTLKDFPELNTSLVVQVKALVILMRKARKIQPEKLTLVPAAYSAKDRYEFRSLGSMVFVAERRGRLVSVYGQSGRDLFRLVRREFSSMGKRRIGSFELYSDKHRLLGAYRYGQRNYQLSAQALMDFILNVSRSPDKKDQIKGPLTISLAFQRFSEIFQTSQPIRKELIKSHLNRPVYECRINGIWIFAISKDAVIEAVIPKF